MVLYQMLHYKNVNFLHNYARPYVSASETDVFYAKEKEAQNILT